MGSVPMEEIERTNTIVVRGQGMGTPRRNSYAMEVDVKFTNSRLSFSLFYFFYLFLFHFIFLFFYF